MSKTVLAGASVSSSSSAAVAATPEVDGLESPRRQWAMFALLAGTFLSTLDASIANIALPTISRDLASSASSTVWVINAYQLAVAVSVLPLAALGERFGLKRFYLFGIGLFVLASLACAQAPSLGFLVASRTLQGLGGACAATLGPALFRNVVPQRMAGRSIALLGLTVAISAACGPTVASSILALADWRWLFYVNLPVGLLVLGIGIWVLPRVPQLPRPFDLVGAVLNAALFALLIIGVGGLGYALAGGDRAPIYELVIAAVIGFVLFKHQIAAKAPLVPIDLLKLPILSLSVLTSICSYTAQTLAYVSLPFLLEHGLGRSTLDTGLLITPWPLVIVLVAPLSGRLSDRYPAGILSSIGLATLGIGLLFLATLPAMPSPANIIWRMIVCGIGFGFFQTPNNRALLTSGPRERSGAAGGIMTMARMIGLTFGAALTALVFEVSGTQGAGYALYTAAGFAFFGAIISVMRLR
jgi:DHA2 family multidrug resistance protein-like MFS transporter